jgi:hypothetical protein
MRGVFHFLHPAQPPSRMTRKGTASFSTHNNFIMADLETITISATAGMLGFLGKWLVDFLKDRHNARNQRTAVSSLPQPVEVKEVHDCTPKAQCDERHRILKEQVENLFARANSTQEKLSGIATKVDMIYDLLTRRQQ